jgi:uncharacterized membrane protein
MVGLITAANETAARNILLLGTAATTDATDYATASQGTKADSALQRTGGTMTGDINMGANNISSTGTITATTFIGNLTGNVDTATKIASISNNNIVQLTETQTLTNKTLISPTITGTGNISGAFTGDLTGNVTGNLTGNVIGNLTGNVDTATKIASISNNNIVQLTETQTLTNKTLISPTITGTGNISGAFTGDLTGNVTGNLTGNVIGNLTGNVDTATKIASISNNNIVQLTETQTLTNKTLISPTITGTGNISGTFTGDLTGNVTGDVTGNVDTATKIASISNSDIVQLNETQTLTNKTLTSPTITGTGDISGTFTGDLTGNVTGEVSTINNHIKAGSDTFKKTSGSSQDFTVSGITNNSIITITLTSTSIYTDSSSSETSNIQPVVTSINGNIFTITTYANGVAVEPYSDFNFNFIIFIPQ